MNVFDVFRLPRYSMKRGFEIPLFSRQMVDYVKLHLYQGLPLDLTLVNKGEVKHYEEDHIFRGVKYLSGVAASPPLDSISICFEVLENVEINAFAKKMPSSKKPKYIVGINSGLAEEFANHFIAQSSVDEMVVNMKSLNQLPLEFLQDAALALSFCFIAFHEIGHIYRGHLDFLNKKMEASIIDEMWADGASLSVEGKVFSRHMFECDADAFAGYLMVGEVISRYKNSVNSGVFSGPKKRILEELVIFSSSVIYYIFCLFDRRPTIFDGAYPVPPIRTAIAVGHLGAGLYKEGLSEGLINKLMIEGIVRTQAIIDANDVNQNTRDLEVEFNRWSSKYMSELGKLGELLAPYKPVKI